MHLLSILVLSSSASSLSSSHASLGPKHTFTCASSTHLCQVVARSLCLRGVAFQHAFLSLPLTSCLFRRAWFGSVGMSLTRRKAANRNAPGIKKAKRGAKQELGGRTGEIPDKKAFPSLCLFLLMLEAFLSFVRINALFKEGGALHFSKEKERDFFHPRLQSALDFRRRLLQTENFVF